MTHDQTAWLIDSLSSSLQKTTLATCIAAYQMQHRASFNVVIPGSLVVVHLLPCKDQPAARCVIVSAYMLPVSSLKDTSAHAHMCYTETPRQAA